MSWIIVTLAAVLGFCVGSLLEIYRSEVEQDALKAMLHQALCDNKRLRGEG